MKYSVKLDIDDCNKIERLHYMVEARVNLLDRLAMRIVNVENTDDAYAKYFSEYEECYMEYVKYKEYLERKYRPESIVPTSWSINFEDAEMVFEVADA